MGGGCYVCGVGLSEPEDLDCKDLRWKELPFTGIGRMVRDRGRGWRGAGGGGVIGTRGPRLQRPEVEGTRVYWTEIVKIARDRGRRWRLWWRCFVFVFLFCFLFVCFCCCLGGHRNHRASTAKT